MKLKREKNSLAGLDQADKCMEKNKRERKKKRKNVLTMPSYACKYHYGWRMQAIWTKTRVDPGGKILSYE